MNYAILIVLTGLGWAIGHAMGHPFIAIGIALALAYMVFDRSEAALDKAIMKGVKERTNSYLCEVWACLPALKRIEAYDVDYATNNLKEIFRLHFPEELQGEIHTYDEIFDLGKFIFVSEVKPLEQIKAFKRHSRKGLFQKKNTDAEATVLHAGRVYARAGATPAMLLWLETWAKDMGVSTDLAHRGYLDEVHLQDNGELQRLISQVLDIDQRLDQIPEALGNIACDAANSMMNRDSLYAEYRKAVGRFNARNAQAA